MDAVTNEQPKQQDQIEQLAARFFAAIEAGDVATVESIYAPDAKIWHNTTQQLQEKAANVKLLGRLTSMVKNWRYTDVQRVVIDGGFVQQHVLRGEAPGGSLALPAMMRVWVSDGHITRLDEYIDGAATANLFPPRDEATASQ